MWDISISEVIARLRALPPPIIGGELREPALQWRYREADIQRVERVLHGLPGARVCRVGDGGGSVRGSREGAAQSGRELPGAVRQVPRLDPDR